MTDELPLARRDLIAARLAEGQSVASVQLAAEFGVSEDAIRRDLRALAADGLCRRVYGGALPLAVRPLSARLGEGVEAKRALAARAATLVERGDLIFLDAGSSHVALVDALPEDFGLTVATNSVDVAAAVMGRQDLDLLMIGGAVDAAIGGAVDAVAIEAVTRLAFDLSFIGVCGVSAEDGVGALNHADAIFKRAVMATSRRRVALVTSDKFEARAPYRIGPVRAFSFFVVEQDAAEAFVPGLVKAGAEVVSVGDPP
ncbi:DeoR/GlpR family DNA-binding transcription regulator [Pleomorphomonas sp. NRK KF1]|uniref:DeoR/GlpR family DNA-binding transcription regulator n=1 Tax=Pleomorphomonas sp. NRK KF1 TaxID=2943000 RepID=UPI0020444430|nr:DeoR/GlpR family DNA-binding transcription regulator [Pleomorphomonas sp. NRK KF1]MCM5555825.1 DeoR/GlpR family DNA-binding transcription regulator [Pleomorphomonas sp. NRK KF1]